MDIEYYSNISAHFKGPYFLVSSLSRPNGLYSIGGDELRRAIEISERDSLDNRIFIFDGIGENVLKDLETARKLDSPDDLGSFLLDFDNQERPEFSLSLNNTKIPYIYPKTNFLYNVEDGNAEKYLLIKELRFDVDQDLPFWAQGILTDRINPDNRHSRKGTSSEYLLSNFELELLFKKKPVKRSVEFQLVKSN
ncbi:MAG: hypothetical protein ACLFUO_01805 [Candidatus Woesearchaeota archaeon]